jgi:RimJ/RimL family protein N-acetyltransferase
MVGVGSPRIRLRSTTHHSEAPLGARLQSAAVAEPQAILIDLPRTLSGPRVVARPYEEADAPAVLASVEESRASLGQWMIWAYDDHEVGDMLANIRRWQARWALREDLNFGIFESETGRHLGGCGLHRIDWRIRKFEIGYWLRDSAVGHGYVTETVQMLTRFAFDRLAAERVEIRMDARNQRSRAVPGRLGFVYEGCLRRAMPDVRGQPRDVDVFALIREDFDRQAWHRA